MEGVTQVRHIDNFGRQYKTVPKKYVSHFNKLNLVSDGYNIYCENIENGEFKHDCDMELFSEYLKEQVSLKLLDMMKSNWRIPY